jgi:Protein of unknown function (DUF2442)
MRGGLLHDIVEARHLGGHRLWLRFDDGLQGEVDLYQVVGDFPGVLSALLDPAFVAQVRVHPEFGTITWPGDLDLDPVVLYCAVKGIPVPTYDRGGRRAKPAKTSSKPRRRTSTRSVKTSSRRRATGTTRRRGKSGRSHR